MRHQTLCDAAIALSSVLTAHATPHAFFGGFAIIELCRENATAYRESKDIDCLVRGNKDDVLRMFEHRLEWMVIPQGREDYVAYFWKSPLDGVMVLVELFVGMHASSSIWSVCGLLANYTETGTRQSHNTPRSIPHVLSSPLYGDATIPILSAVSLFRGKLNACATRSKDSDVSDLLFLIALFPREAKAGGKKVDKKVVAAAIARWPQLRSVLERSGTPVKQKLLVGGQCYIQAGKISEGDVHRGLGCAW